MTLEQVRAEPRDDRRRCPLCFDGLAAADAARACDACGTSYHAACFDELGGCSTTGCARARVRPAPVAPRVAPDPQEAEPAMTPFGAIVGAALGIFSASGQDGFTFAFFLLAGTVLGVMGELFLPDGVRRAVGARRAVVRRLARHGGPFLGGAVVGAMLALIPYAVLTGVLLKKSGSPIVIGTTVTIIVVSGLVAAWHGRNR